MWQLEQFNSRQTVLTHSHPPRLSRSFSGYWQLPDLGDRDEVRMSGGEARPEGGSSHQSGVEVNERYVVQSQPEGEIRKFHNFYMFYMKQVVKFLSI